MILNYFKTSLRNLIKRRFVSLINLTGLSISLALFIMIGLYLEFETSYDAFHDNADNTYLLTKELKTPTTQSLMGKVNYPEGELILQDYPQVDQVVRMYKSDNSLTKSGDLVFMENNFFFVDKGFFELFDFELVKGDKSNVLEGIDNVVITESTALKYFGTTDAIGKIITVTEQYWNATNDFVVSGIAKDTPLNSHIQFDFLTSFDAFERLTGFQKSAKEPVWYWGWNAFQAYVSLHEGVNTKEFEEGLSGFVEQYYPDRFKAYSILTLTPIKEVYLRPDIDNGHGIAGNPSTIKVLSGIALFILIIACINFVNLTTARSSLYAREIGVKKVLGARRIQLFSQLITESIILTFSAIVLAVVIVELAIPVFQNAVGRPMEVTLFSWPAIAKLALLGFGIGVLSGFYPGVIMSGFKPLTALKGEQVKGEGKVSVRKVLVVFQFTVSIVMVLASAVIYRQLVHMTSKDLGFEKDQLLYVQVPSGISSGSTQLTAQYESLQDRLRQLSGVKDVTSIEERPGEFIGSQLMLPEGAPLEDPVALSVMWVDEHFFSTFDIPILEGELGTYGGQKAPVRYFLNESAAKMFDWEDPLGKQMAAATRNGAARAGLVQGRIPDFNFESLHNPIEPMIIGLWPNHLGSGRWNLFVKANTTAYNELIEEIRGVWKEYYPGRPFDISFLDQSIEAQYQAQINLLKILPYLTGFAVFIACLGLFGLASFVVERRTKEVGIRKVLGASVEHVVLLISNDFMKLLVVANIIAWPLAYYYLKDWLSDFNYRISLSWGFFVLAGLTVMLVAFVTVGTKVLKGARSNPIDSLRYE